MELCSCFQRFEQKYLLDTDTYQKLRLELTPYMESDQYGISHISSIYFDTPDRRLVRSSLEKPVYKEKLRLRCYGLPGPQDPVYVEVKMKYKGIVYKRRVEMPLKEAEAYLYHGCRPARDTQVLREVDYMRQFYRELVPAAYIGYERVALYGLENSGLRVTFDWNLRWRDQNLHLDGSTEGRLLLPEDQWLMEIKLPDVMPLWMARLFNRLQVFPTSFSKYGTAYRESAYMSRIPESSQANSQQKGEIICAS